MEGFRYRQELLSLRCQKQPRILACTVEQRKLDQQLGPDVAIVARGPSKPGSRGFAPGARGLDERSVRSGVGWLDVDGDDKAIHFEPLKRPVDDGLRHAPYLAQFAIIRQHADEGEAVRWCLADQAQNDPLG